jgi:acylphosphatase
VSITHCIKGYVSGRVQGVGFRYFVKTHADAQSVNGYAKNLADGGVKFLLQGEKSAVLSVLQKIHSGPSYSQVFEVKTEECSCEEIADQFQTI